MNQKANSSYFYKYFDSNTAIFLLSIVSHSLIHSLKHDSSVWINRSIYRTIYYTYRVVVKIWCYNKNKVEINCYICKIELLVITSLFINQYIKLACKHSCWGSKYIPIWIAEVCLIIIFISIYERRGEGALGRYIELL